MSRPKVSVVVVNYRADSLIAQWRKRFAQHPECELLVVDHSHGKAGYSEGCNIGARMASAPVLICANPDVELHPKHALALGAFLESHPDLAVVGPQLLTPTGEVQVTCSAVPGPWMAAVVFSFLHSWPGFSWWTQAYRLFSFDHRSDREVPSVSGACFAMRTKEFRQLGGLDERYFLYFEEFDLAQRISRILRKKIWFTAQISLPHAGQVSTRQHKNVTPIFRASRKAYLTKWFGWRGRAVDAFLRFFEGEPS